MKINNCRSDLTDISAKKEALVTMYEGEHHVGSTSLSPVLFGLATKQATNEMHHHSTYLINVTPSILRLNTCRSLKLHKRIRCSP